MPGVRVEKVERYVLLLDLEDTAGVVWELGLYEDEEEAMDELRAVATGLGMNHGGG